MNADTRAKVMWALPFLAVLVGAVAIGALGVMRAYLSGPSWDTCDYLTNALFFTGGYPVDYVLLPIRPPLISLVTAVAFNIWSVDEVALFCIDAAFYVMGVGAFYLILESRFLRTVAVVGAVLYACSLPLLEWVAVGYSDVFAISFALVMLYLVILAFHHDRRFFIPAWICGVLMVLARHTTPFILIIPVFYASFCWSKGFDYRYNIYGAVAGLFTYLAFTPVLTRAYGSPVEYLSLIVSRALSAYNDPGSDSIFIVLDKWYYAKAIDNVVTQSRNLAVLVAIIVFFGLCVSLFRSSLYSKKYVTGSVFYAFCLLCSFYVAPSWSFLSGTVLICGLLFLAGRYLGAHEHHDLALDLAFFLWFFVGLSYFSNVDTKVVRFMIMFLPPLYYAVALGLSGYLPKTPTRRIPVGVAALVIVLLVSVAGMVQYYDPSGIYAAYSDGDRYDESLLADDLSSLIGTLGELDPDAYYKNVYASSWTLASWLFKKTVHPLDSGISGDRTEYELQMYGCDYFLDEYRAFASYESLATVRGIHLFARTDVWDRPDILYIGRNLENYIGEVLGFEIFVRNGEYVIREYSVYVDDYSIEELSGYDAVLLYKFKWRNFDAMLDLIDAYVSGGGTLIISGSGNMREDAFDLDGRSLFGVTVLRKPYIKNPDIYIDPVFGGEYSFSAFVLEGSTWYGTTYIQMEDSTFDILARAGNNVLVAEQGVGAGTIFWLGGNIVYHSFVSYDRSERSFVKDAFWYMILK